MASTGTAFFPSTTSYPNTTQYPGQGTQPIFRARYSTDDASDSTPTWNELPPLDSRSFSTSRGRESELSEFDAGSATITVDNRDRNFDPNFNAAIRPLNRWWLYEEFSGEVHDLFKGWAESYDNQWPGWGGSDAECVVTCSDEFKVLALDALDVTDPPRDTYPDIVSFDDPQAYWQMTDDANGREVRATAGTTMLMSGTVASMSDSPIVGDATPVFGTASLRLAAGAWLQAAINDVGEPGDLGNALGFVAVETWFKTSNARPAAAGYIVQGPIAGVSEQYRLKLNTTGTVEWAIFDNTSVFRTVTSSVALESDRWYHIVGSLDIAGALTLWINGVQVGSLTIGGVPHAVTVPGAFLYFLNPGAGGDLAYFTHAATYVHSFSSRINAHYVAGALRGFPQTVSGARIGVILDSVSSSAPRNLQAGDRTIAPRYMRGQSPLDQIKEVVTGEQGDSVFFTDASGELTFLKAGHRSSSPYSTSQATFGDGAGEIPYLDVNVEYAESFLENDVSVTADGGLLQTASDATSIARYFRRSTSLSGLPLTSNADALTIATERLAKYKDPMQRVTQIVFSTVDASAAEAIFRREIGDKITVKRTPPGGGARISQDLFIQKVDISGDNTGAPWSVTWSVSPL